MEDLTPVPLPAGAAAGHTAFDIARLAADYPDLGDRLTVTGLGIGLSLLLMPLLAPLDLEPGLTLVVVAGALLAALSGLFRRAGTDVPRLLIGAGLTVGGVLAWLI